MQFFGPLYSYRFFFFFKFEAFVCACVDMASSSTTDAAAAEAEIVNPHVPEYMAKRPWYLDEGSEKSILDHQKAQAKEKYDNRATFHNHLRTLVEAPERWAKYGLGSRARAHKDVDSLGEPGLKRRKIGSAAAQGNNPNLSFDAKRDRYNGYDPDEHMKTVNRYNKLAELRKEVKAEERRKRLVEKEKRKAEEQATPKGAGSDSDSSSDSSSDDSSSDESDDDDLRISDHQDKNMTAGRKHVGAKSSQVGLTIKNLRQRENTAKYLMNLNPNSAYYDPKSRSMRANPHPELDPSESEFIGDNTARVSGDAVRLAQTQVFAWSQGKHRGTAGGGTGLMGNPTELELAKKKFEERQSKAENMKKKTLLHKYGGEQHMNQPHRELLLGSTENYIEYSADGRILKGHAPAVPKSRYDEDVLIQNHTSAWGSYFDVKTKKWGYQCCWQTTKNAYCIGDALKKA